MSDIVQLHPKGYRVLVVDDDPVFTATAAYCLGRAGYRVQTAADGVEALQLLDLERFDLAIIDLVMPRIDGFRLIALIRGAARLQQLAILVVSSRKDDAVFREATALGADATLSKPVDWPAMPARVAEIIGAATGR